MITIILIYIILGITVSVITGVLEPYPEIGEEGHYALPASMVLFWPVVIAGLVIYKTGKFILDSIHYAIEKSKND